MSPEQVRGLEIDRTTDIFSLGAVFYEMIAGVAPFDEATLGDTIVAVLTRQPVPLYRQNPGTSPEIQKIIARCLNKDRGLRYQTMTSLIYDLENSASGATPTANKGSTRVFRAAFTDQPTIQTRTDELANEVTVRDPEGTPDTGRASLRGRIRRRPLPWPRLR
jgi:serine/threonine protein kinase